MFSYLLSRLLKTVLDNLSIGTKHFVEHKTNETGLEEVKN